MGVGREDIQWKNEEAAETTLGESQATASNMDTRRMKKIQRMGAWLSVVLSTVNGTELVDHEWIDFLLLSYGINPPDLLDHCGGYRDELFICNALECKKCGIITARHNKLLYGVTDLAGKAFTPTYMHVDPNCFTCCAVRRGKDKTKGNGAPPQD